MAEANGHEGLVCITCQQPAKLQCPRWCAATPPPPPLPLAAFCGPLLLCCLIAQVMRWCGSGSSTGPFFPSAFGKASGRLSIMQPATTTAAHPAAPPALSLCSLELNLERDLAAFCSQVCPQFLRCQRMRCTDVGSVPSSALPCKASKRRARSSLLPAFLARGHCSLPPLRRSASRAPGPTTRSCTSRRPQRGGTTARAAAPAAPSTCLNSSGRGSCGRTALGPCGR